MKKIHCAERHDWKQTADSLGFLFHTIDDEPYWDESAYYQFTLKQIEQDLEDPTTEIHDMTCAWTSWPAWSTARNCWTA